MSHVSPGFFDKHCQRFFKLQSLHITELINKRKYLNVLKYRYKKHNKLATHLWTPEENLRGKIRHLSPALPLFPVSIYHWWTSQCTFHPILLYKIIYFFWYILLIIQYYISIISIVLYVQYYKFLLNRIDNIYIYYFI